MFAIAGSDRPLSSLTVVDLTRYLPGPYGTRLLADLGATIVRVEPPQGDPMRGIAWYDLLNRGKQVVTLDLREAAAREELHALLARADVCVEGFKPETARGIGVDGATLSARYPMLVHCSISGYGQHGPNAGRAAHDINYQGDAGLLGAPPRVPNLLIADITGALHATIAILAALFARGDRAAAGAALDISLFDAARAWAPFLAPRYFAATTPATTSTKPPTGVGSPLVPSSRNSGSDSAGTSGVWNGLLSSSRPIWLERRSSKRCGRSFASAPVMSGSRNCSRATAAFQPLRRCRFSIRILHLIGSSPTLQRCT